MNRYPLWKYLLLVILVTLGLLYAIPNFFGEDSVLQISGAEGSQVTAATQSLVTTTLQKDNVAVKSIATEDNGLLVVRFNSVPEQMKAKDILQATLNGSSAGQFVVAQNLLGVTPKWLQDIGAHPMKLGLDLRGGMHFLLQVDVNAVIAARAKNDMRSMVDNLRQADLRYAGIRPDTNGSLLIKFRDPATQQAAQTQLQKNYPDYQITPLTQGSDLYLRLQITPAALEQTRDYVMTQTMTVLRNRIDALGVAEPIVSRQGIDRVVVELPGVQDMALAKQMLGGTATLEFHLVDAQHDLQSALAGMAPIGSRVYYMTNGQPLLLQNQVVLSGSAITFAAASFDQAGQSSVDIRIAGSQVTTFAQATGANIGKQMAIVYVETKNTPGIVDGKVVNTARRVEHIISAPVIQSALPASFQITGMASTQEAKNLSIMLKSGALPANMYPIEERNVGPSLGAVNIQRGIISVIAGFVLIVLFMLVYYRLMGLVANLALFMNVVFIVAIMSIIGVTLTLPGMAAIVLTMGLAVDANVLIFERIREELRNGASVQAAIQAGYARAFATILDANMTTLIVAFALFGIGIGAVQGFAITLIIGIITSMVTAVMGSRAIVNLIYGNRHNVKTISIGM
ncbi:MAG: protein translocase subunit SecD [Gammaproteobacteria bacterium]|nr:protein translocase subunit SecD [Gammaproteobacteria bacterium]